MTNDIQQFETIRLSRHAAGFATLLLNRPDALNAMNPALINDISHACDIVAQDSTIRALIVTGAGRAFCAGGDIHEDVNPLRSKSVADFHRYIDDAMVMYRQLIDLNMPVIAAINGVAVGGGFDIALCCDMRIAGASAKLGEFFVRMGLAPEIGSYLLPRLVGDGWAKRLAMTGDLIDAQQALRIGLVEEVVDDQLLIAHAEQLAARLATGPCAIGAIKKAINVSYGMNLDAAADHTLRLQYQMVHTEDHKEAVTAWLEKRKPVFSGR